MNPHKIIFLLAFVAAIFWVEIALDEPAKAYGQPKGKSVGTQGMERDPFSLPPGVRHQSSHIPGIATKIISTPSEVKMPPLERGTPSPEANHVDMGPPALTLKALLIGEHVRLATINRHIVSVGDSIQGEKVLEIHADHVILGKGDKKRTLVLFQNPIRLTVDENQGGKK